MAKSIYATLAEKVQIHGMLTERLEQVSPDTWRYKDPTESDTTIAFEVHERLRANHVAHVRTEIFGRLANNRTALTRNGTNDEYELRFNLLIDKLQMQGVMDIHYLKFQRETEDDTAG